MVALGALLGNLTPRFCFSDLWIVKFGNLLCDSSTIETISNSNDTLEEVVFSERFRGSRGPDILECDRD